MTMTFAKAHPRQLENSLRWLRKLRADVDAEIRALEAEAAALTHDSRARAAFNGLMRDLISENCTVTEAEKRLVQQGYEPSAVSASAKALKRLAQRRRREMRDAEILRRVLLNEPHRDLAKEYGISRQQVYRIAEKQNPLRR